MPSKLVTTTCILSRIERRSHLKTNSMTANVEQTKPVFPTVGGTTKSNDQSIPVPSFDAGRKFDVDSKPLAPTVVLPKANPKEVFTSDTIDKRIPIEDPKPVAPEFVQKKHRNYNIISNCNTTRT
jgi:hypothetical protein